MWLFILNLTIMLHYRKANLEDSNIYYNWINDPTVRAQSFNSAEVDLKNHNRWFESKIEDDSCFMLIFQDENDVNVGQIRIQKESENEALIGISIAEEHRGKGYAKEMLRIASDLFLKANVDFKINAYIKENNSNSKYAFEKAGFDYKNEVNYENFQSFHYVKEIK